MNRIKHYLQKMGKSQGWLSIKSGIDRQYISRVCNDKVDVRLSTAKKISKAMKLPMDSLWP